MNSTKVIIRIMFILLPISIRSTLYIGMTNNLKVRLEQHHQNIIRGNKTFASKYNIEFLVYYEKFTWLQLAIVREKKLNLIRSFNANFEFLNGRFAGPDVIPHASE